MIALTAGSENKAGQDTVSSQARGRAGTEDNFSKNNNTSERLFCLVIGWRDIGMPEKSEDFRPKVGACQFWTDINLKISPRPSLPKRRIIPPFGKGRLGGIFLIMCPHYYETFSKCKIATHSTRPFGWVTSNVDAESNGGY